MQFLLFANKGIFICSIREFLGGTYFTGIWHVPFINRPDALPVTQSKKKN